MPCIATTYDIDKKKVPDSPGVADLVVGRKFAIGKDVNALEGIRLDDVFASRFHGTVQVDLAGKILYTDLGSTNGTLVLRKNSATWKTVPPKKSEKLEVEDRLIIGHTRLQVRPESATEFKLLVENAHNLRSSGSPRHPEETVIDPELPDRVGD
jgi:pSer/pThr/pTyr-binding forkhead associated (FHA) protein